MKNQIYLIRFSFFAFKYYIDYQRHYEYRTNRENTTVLGVLRVNVLKINSVNLTPVTLMILNTNL